MSRPPPLPARPNLCHYRGMLRARPVLPATALAGALLAACAPSPNPMRLDAKVSHLINYTDRDDRLLARRHGDWIRLEYLGPQEAPISSLWLSPRPLGQGAPFNDILVLTPDAWARASLRLATTDCPAVAPPNYTAVKLTVALAGRVTRHCLAGRPADCAYAEILQGLAAEDLLAGDLDARRAFFNVCATGFAG